MAAHVANRHRRLGLGVGGRPPKLSEEGHVPADLYEGVTCLGGAREDVRQGGEDHAALGLGRAEEHLAEVGERAGAGELADGAGDEGHVGNGGEGALRHVRQVRREQRSERAEPSRLREGRAVGLVGGKLGNGLYGVV